MEILTCTVDLSVDGLFRVSGSKKRQDQLKRELDNPERELLDVDALNRTYSPHDVASVVKQYFAELPDSILQSKNFVAYEQVAGKILECIGDRLEVWIYMQI